MKVVLDTNILLSASFTRGTCEVLVDLCFTSGDVVVVLSEHILREFVLHSIDKVHAPADKAELMAAALRQRCHLVEPAEVPINVFEDTDDLPVLGTAVAGECDALVTGDQKLLALKAYQNIPILSPRAFYDRLRKS